MSRRTQSKRFWLGGGAAVAVLIVLFGWFGVVNPQLSSALSTHDLADSARQQNVLLQAKNAKLKLQNDKIATLRASLTTALAQLPSDGGLPAFTRQVAAQATANSVVLSSITVGAATAVADASAVAVATTATPAATATSAAIASTPTSGALVEIQITLVAAGLGTKDLAFLKAIQVTGPRRALVTASQLTSSSGAGAGINGPCTLNLQLTIFSAPLSPEAQTALLKLLSGK